MARRFARVPELAAVARSGTRSGTRSGKGRAPFGPMPLSPAAKAPPLSTGHPDLPRVTPCRSERRRSTTPVRLGLAPRQRLRSARAGRQ